MAGCTQVSPEAWAQPHGDTVEAAARKVAALPPGDGVPPSRGVGVVRDPRLVGKRWCESLRFSFEKCKNHFSDSVSKFPEGDPVHLFLKAYVSIKR